MDSLRRIPRRTIRLREWWLLSHPLLFLFSRFPCISTLLSTLRFFHQACQNALLLFYRAIWRTRVEARTRKRNSQVLTYFAYVPQLRIYASVCVCVGRWAEMGVGCRGVGYSSRCTLFHQCDFPGTWTPANLGDVNDKEDDGEEEGHWRRGEASGQRSWRLAMLSLSPLPTPSPWRTRVEAKGTRPSDYVRHTCQVVETPEAFN